MKPIKARVAGASDLGIVTIVGFAPMTYANAVEPAVVFYGSDRKLRHAALTNTANEPVFTIIPEKNKKGGNQ